MQSSIRQWTAQAAIHAFRLLPEVVCFCVARFRSESPEADGPGGGAEGIFGKDRAPVSINDRVIRMPSFASEHTVDLTYTE